MGESNSEERAVAPTDRIRRTQAPRLPVYLDGELLEALAQTLDPSGVPGTRRVQTMQTGRTLEGHGYAVRASGRFGTRLLGAEATGEKKRSGEDEASDAQTHEQEFVVREATLLWQAHSLLAEEGHLKVIDGSTIHDVVPGDWVEMRAQSTGRSLMSFAHLANRVTGMLSEQADRRLAGLREGEALLRGTKPNPAAMKIGDLTVNQAREAFLSDLVATLAASSNEEDLQAAAAINGFADEVRNAEISDITTRFLDPKLSDWSAVLTVRTAAHERLASGALHDAEFGVFGKASLVRREGDPIRLVRRTMLDWMDQEELESMSSGLTSTFGSGALTVTPPVVQVLPLALWV